MSSQIPSDFAPFVHRMIESKRFFSEEDVIAEGLRLLQSQEMLREEVRKGFDQLNAAQIVPADLVFDHANARIQAIEQGK